MKAVKLEPHNPEWLSLYETERERLFNELGFIAFDGVVWRMAHVGSTSIPNVPARACIDIVIDTFPLPIEKKTVTTMLSLGYIYHGNDGGRQLFKRGDTPEYAVYFVNVEHGHFINEVLLSKYLQKNSNKARQFAAEKLKLASNADQDSYNQAKSSLFAPYLKAAHVWHVEQTGFNPVHKLQAELDGIDIPWHISSGWALDLFLGQASRYHDDVDIVIQRQHQLSLQKRLRAQGWTLNYVNSGKYFYWQDDFIIPLNFHQIHAHKEDDFIDILLEPDTEGSWRFRRNTSIHLPKGEAFHKKDNIPFLAPEIVLLFKSTIRKGKIRDKDQQDFERLLSNLHHKQQKWLSHSIATDLPEHPWLELLSYD